jgi:hypothetical protein
MKKFLAPLVILLIVTAIVYSVRINGVDVVNALGTLMIIAGLLITYRIFMAKPKKRNEFS